MDPITVLLRISGGSIVLLVCLYTAIALYWYLTEDDATTYQTSLGATDTNTPRTEDTTSQRSPEDTSTASQRTPWAADTNTTRAKSDSSSPERLRRQRRR